MSSSFGFNNLELLLCGHPIFDDYDVIDQIKINGKRALFHVISKESNKQLMIKFISKKTVSDELLNIYQFIYETKHENLSKINKIIEDDDFIILILDYIDGFNMNTYFMKCDISKKQRNQIILILLKTIYFLHYHNILHGDIKPENIMITKNNIPIIIDFDLSRYCYDHGYCKRPFGTKIYISPEIYHYNTYYLKSDIWSFGLTVFNSIIYDVLHENRYFKLFYSNKLNHKKSSDVIMVMNKFEKKLKNKFGNLLFNLIKIMIIDDIDMRPSSKEIFDSIKKTKYFKN